MATIVIKDLSENMELDRQALLAVIGGARSRGESGALAGTPFRKRPINIFTGLPQLNPQGSGIARGREAAR